MAIRIFQHYWQLPLAILALIEACLFFTAPYVGVFLRFRDSLPAIEALIGPMLPRGLVFASILFVSMAAVGLYNARQRSRLAGLLARVAASVLGGTLFTAVVFYLFPALHVGSGVLLLSAVIAFGGAVIVRTTFDLLVNEDLFKRRVVVYGAGRQGASVASLKRRAGPPRCAGQA